MKVRGLPLLVRVCVAHEEEGDEGDSEDGEGQCDHAAGAAGARELELAGNQPGEGQYCYLSKTVRNTFSLPPKVVPKVKEEEAGDRDEVDVGPL